MNKLDQGILLCRSATEKYGEVLHNVDLVKLDEQILS